ncbi:MAG: ATP-binding protein, partial [Acidimicrobiales bacterium]
MWFERVRAAAFGPLRDAVLDLAPGMNVIWGPNESGKSSWHAAILLGLCGLPRTKGKPRRDHRELEERRSPRWSDDWSAGVTVRLADGRALEFSQDLARRTGTVRDANLGRDCTGDYLDANSPDGARLVGLDRDSFRAVACVEQAAILRITADAGALQDQLQRAAATAGTESTAREAIELVDAFLKSHVGPRRQNSTRPLQTVLNRVAATERALAAARRAHDELLERASAVDVAERVAAQAELAARRAEAAYELARARERLERDERVRALAAAHPVPPPTPAV